jgi:hypothetical protein
MEWATSFKRTVVWLEELPRPARVKDTIVTKSIIRDKGRKIEFVFNGDVIAIDSHFFD